MKNIDLGTLIIRSECAIGRGQLGRMLRGLKLINSLKKPYFCNNFITSRD